MFGDGAVEPGRSCSTRLLLRPPRAAAAALQAALSAGRSAAFVRMNRPPGVKYLSSNFRAKSYVHRFLKRD